MLLYQANKKIIYICGVICNDITCIITLLLQNLSHPGVVNLEKMFETPERVSNCWQYYIS